jgi:hypothetical protein
MKTHFSVYICSFQLQVIWVGGSTFMFHKIALCYLEKSRNTPEVLLHFFDILPQSICMNLIIRMMWSCSLFFFRQILIMKDGCCSLTCPTFLYMFWIMIFLLLCIAFFFATLPSRYLRMDGQTAKREMYIYTSTRVLHFFDNGYM